MPTTLITTVQGIGLGIMGQALAERVPGISRIIGVRRLPNLKIDLKFPARCTIEVHERNIPPAAVAPDGKYLYIEQSYDLSRHITRNSRALFVPMWEQGLTLHEAPLADEIVCVTKYTRQYIDEHSPADPFSGRRCPCTRHYLPWPVATEHIAARRVGRVKTILHNAGSLGGNLRKGTDAAIVMFQRSGLARDGVLLVIHSWMAPTPMLSAQIAHAPDGIVWTRRFLERPEDIYDEYTPDLLLMPSKIEGHALVALEAMARGVPALVTNSAPINEYEQDDEFLLPVAQYEASPLGGPYALVDLDAGAERLRRVCMRDLSDKSIESREYVRKFMSWRALGEAWESLCE